MKIGYLLKKFPRLSETFVLGEILGQEAQGTDVVVLARRPADDEPRHPALARLRAPILPVGDEGLNPWKELFGAPDLGAGLLPRLAAVMPLLLSSNPDRVPKLVAEALWVLRATREQGIDHLHVHFATESAVVAWIVMHLGGPGYSVTAHAKDIYRSSVDPRLLTRLVGDSAFTVTVCDANVEHLRGLVEPDDFRKVRRLYNGIDLDAFTPGSRRRARCRVLSVGRLVAKKGFDTLLESIPDLLAAHPSLEVRIAGTGEDELALRQLAARLGVVDAVTFLGPVDQETVARELGRATVFCLPCRVGDDGNRDALPTVLLEALAAGVPTVSTPVTGIPEILDRGRVGRLVEPDDPAGLAGALDGLLREPDERERLAAAGRRHAERHFDRRLAARTLARWFHEAAVEEAVA